MQQQPPKKSVKTTTSGIIAAVGLLLIAAAAYFDGDPTTKTNMGQVAQSLGTLMAAFGVGAAGFFSRDDDVTSEGQQANK